MVAHPPNEIHLVLNLSNPVQEPSEFYFPSALSSGRLELNGTIQINVSSLEVELENSISFVQCWHVDQSDNNRANWILFQR